MTLTKDQKWIINDMANSIKGKLTFQLTGCHFFDLTDNEVETLADKIAEEFTGALTVLAESKGVTDG